MVALEEARDEIALTTAKLRDIVDNVQFGFLIIDRSLRVSDEVTRSCAQLFGRPNVASSNLLDVLRLSGNARLTFALAISELFEDVMPETLLLAQIPSRFEIDDRVLNLSATTLRDDAGVIHSVLFSVADATRLEAEQRENERSQALIGILKRRESFEFFLADTRRLIAAAHAAVAAGEQDVARHALHTVKGNSGCYALHPLAKLVHQVEELPHIGSADVDRVEQYLTHFLRDHHVVLGLDAQGHARPDRRVAIRLDELDELQAALARGDVARAQQWAATARHVPAGRLLGPVEELVHQTAQRYGRKVRLQRSGEQLRVPQDRLGDVLANVCHLLRNAVVHGIESPDERGEKPEAGEVGFCLSQHDDHYLVRVHDDGRGVDWDGVVEQAVASRILSAEQARDLSHAQRVDLLFQDGLSSAVQVTESAGRGVGMGAVRRAATSVGGTLELTSEPGRGTTVEIRVPLQVPRPDLVVVTEPTRCAEPARFDRQFFIASGNEDPYRATLGLATALSAVSSGSSVVVFFTMRGAQWTGVADVQTQAVPGFPPIAELVELLVEGGARLEGCTSCVQHHLDAPVGEDGRKQLATGIHFAGLSEAVMRMDHTPTTVF